MMHRIVERVLRSILAPSPIPRHDTRILSTWYHIILIYTHSSTCTKVLVSNETKALLRSLPIYLIVFSLGQPQAYLLTRFVPGMPFINSMVTMVILIVIPRPIHTIYLCASNTLYFLFCTEFTTGILKPIQRMAFSIPYHTKQLKQAQNKQKAHLLRFCSPDKKKKTK